MENMNVLEHSVHPHTRYRITLRPRKYVIVECFQDDRFITMKKFEIGDEAEYDSFNLHYIGDIAAIGLKTVTIRTGKHASSKSKRLSAVEFAWRNWNFDSEKIRQFNSEEMMCL